MNSNILGDFQICIIAPLIKKTLHISISLIEESVDLKLHKCIEKMHKNANSILLEKCIKGLLFRQY